MIIPVGPTCPSAGATIGPATTTELPTGLFERVGLTVSDAWIITTAVAIRRGVAFHTPNGWSPP